MATVSLDVGPVIQALWTIISQIKDEKRVEKERAKDAQLLVYHALSIHPALDYMRPPTGVLGDMDWYTELRAPFRSVIFRKLVQNQHFKRTALLGEIGTRARIMLLLLWIIGHRLNDDQITRLLSTAVGDSLARAESGTLAQELAQIDSVKRVLVDLRQMIKTKLPLPPDRNPFLGRDYQMKDEDLPLPRADLWGYELPPEEQYEYDVRRNPSMLLKRFPSRVIIPQTKLTLLLIQWATANFGLGKKVHSRADIDPNAYWNADPPADEDEDSESEFDFSTPDSSLDMPFEHGYTEAPYDISFRRLSREDWLHLRYCQVYPTHDWVHDRFIRILLFNSYCGTGRLPTRIEARAIGRLVQQLQLIVPEDVWDHMEPYILAQAFFLWRDRDANSPDNIDFKTSNHAREMSSIFVDMVKWYEDLPILVDCPSTFQDIRSLLVDPSRVCPDAPDILSLPLLQDVAVRAEDRRHDSINPFPIFGPQECTCGECEAIHTHLSSSLDFFPDHFFSVTDNASSRGCDAIARTWEPLLCRAEEWFEGLLGRIESPAMLPWVSELRLGPAVLGIASVMGLEIGSDPPVDAVLRFVVTLSSMHKGYPLAFPTPLPASGLGYVVKLTYSSDREDFRPDDAISDEIVEHVLFAVGSWLYDLAGSEGVTLLYDDDDRTIDYYSLSPAKFSAVCMPGFRPDFPVHAPSRHTDLSKKITRLRSADTENSARITVLLSNLQGHGFPLLSVKGPLRAPMRGALAALLRISVAGRVVETVWKPDLRAGAQCDHTDSYGIMTHCAPTAYEVLMLAEPSDAPNASPNWMQLLKMESSEERCREALRNRMDEYQRRTNTLRQGGSPMERHRACIVRCGSEDGPMDAMIILAASLHKRVYVINHRECWDCALARMHTIGCTVSLAIETKTVTACDRCHLGDRHAV